MDKYELRALELENEQKERLAECLPGEQFWDHFELALLQRIQRYRRVSSTYPTYLKR